MLFLLFFSYAHLSIILHSLIEVSRMTAKEKDLCLNKGKGLAKQIYAITPDGS